MPVGFAQLVQRFAFLRQQQEPGVIGIGIEPYAALADWQHKPNRVAALGQVHRPTLNQGLPWSA